MHVRIFTKFTICNNNEDESWHIYTYDNILKEKVNWYWITFCYDETYTSLAEQPTYLVDLSSFVSYFFASFFSV